MHYISKETTAREHDAARWAREEIDLLLRRWAQAKGGEGSVVLVSGEPGIGKSCIAEAILECSAANRLSVALAPSAREKYRAREKKYRSSAAFSIGTTSASQTSASGSARRRPRGFFFCDGRRGALSRRRPVEELNPALAAALLAAEINKGIKRKRMPRRVFDQGVRLARVLLGKCCYRVAPACLFCRFRRDQPS